jgi:hypothetical protein
VATTVKPALTTKDDPNDAQTTTSSSSVKIYTSFVSIFLATIILL